MSAPTQGFADNYLPPAHNHPMNNLQMCGPFLTLDLFSLILGGGTPTPLYSLGV